MRLTLRNTPAALLTLTVLAYLTPTPVAAQSRWKEIGKTSTGNIVLVDPRSVKTVNHIVTARIRVRFTTPVVTPRGNWAVSQHIAMFDCARSLVASKESIYYSDAAATKVVEKTTIGIPGFGSPIGGSMTRVALDHFCPKR